jgi:ribonuclease T2
MPRRSASLCTLALAASLLGVSLARADDGARPHAFRHADPGDVDYYALVLSGSPTHCLTEGHERGDDQCDEDRQADFVLHGLWPQYDLGWPEDCYKGERPWIPSDVIQEMEGIMPDKEVIIHEYKTHGTCTGLSPSDYFSKARKAYEQVTIPAPLDDPQTQRFLSPKKIESEFQAANDWLQPDMIAVTCRRGNLFDVRICFSTELKPRACGANINQKMLCPLQRITVPVPKNDR